MKYCVQQINKDITIFIHCGFFHEVEAIKKRKKIKLFKIFVEQSSHYYKHSNFI